MSQKPDNNQYAKATSAYGDNAQKNAPDQRELEARVLLKSANKLQAIQKDWDNLDIAHLDETLRYNRSIWIMFYDTALENPENNRPNDLRSNIINLANFIFKREMDIMNKPSKEKLDILISINRDIAAGLMTNPDKAENQEGQEADQSSETTSAAPQQDAPQPEASGQTQDTSA